MPKKILLVIASTLFLSGCALLPKTNNAATDADPGLPPSSQVTPTPVPSLTPSDINEMSTFEKSQTTSTGNDISSLEKDLNTTVIPDDNLTDILAN